jgi:hypothetical protein
MLVTLTHPISGFTGTVTVKETIVLPFTNGTSNIDVDPTAFGAIQSSGILISIGAQAPAPPYDANLDTTVAPLVTNSGSTTATALRAAFGPRAASVGLMGTSVTANHVDPISGVCNAIGFFGWANALADHRFQVTYFDGVPGSHVIGSAARFTAAAASTARVIVVEFGTNDMAAGATAADCIAAFTTGLTTLLAAGKTPVVLTVHPRNDLDATKAGQRGILNNWIKNLPTTMPGVYIADTAAWVADPANASAAQWISGWSQDGVHPNVIGAQQMGRGLAPVLEALWPPNNLVTGPHEPNRLGQNVAYWSADGARPVNWFGSDTGSITWSRVARDDSVPGYWQRAVVPTSGVVRLTAPAQGAVAGDRLVAFCEFRTSAVNYGDSTHDFYIDLTAYSTPSYTPLANVADLRGDGTNHPPYAAGVLQTPVLTVPVGTGEVDMQIVAAGAGTYDFGRVGVVRV